MLFKSDDFKLVVVVLGVICAIVGAVLFAAVCFIAPWVWSLIKPWLHAVTG